VTSIIKRIAIWLLWKVLWNIADDQLTPETAVSFGEWLGNGLRRLTFWAIGRGDTSSHVDWCDWLSRSLRTAADSLTQTAHPQDRPMPDAGPGMMRE